MEYHSVITKDESLFRETTWMNLADTEWEKLYMREHMLHDSFIKTGKISLWRSE